MAKMITNKAEEQEKAIEEVFEKMNLLEKGMRELLPDGAPRVDAQNLGALDILVSATFGPYMANEEVFGVKVLDRQKYPLLFSWAQKLNKLPYCARSAPSSCQAR
ncbi:putative Glutathione s-transferase [Melia azedarach]|uniref:Glutathione s-transferase n=1 Tax=Melia azedarach TaxID=155640 RepID=A0ACC1XL30_MELAZ|nr:putative Glutathione s-transferase [Melia azedarach]